MFGYVLLSELRRTDNAGVQKHVDVRYHYLLKVETRAPHIAQQAVPLENGKEGCSEVAGGFGPAGED